MLASSKATVLELLAYHADLLAVYHCGWAPLHRAAYNGDVGSLTALFDAGANVASLLTRRRETALHVAASRENVKAVQLLVKRNLNDQTLLSTQDEEA